MTRCVSGLQERHKTQAALRPLTVFFYVNVLARVSCHVFDVFMVKSMKDCGSIHNAAGAPLISLSV